MTILIHSIEHTRKTDAIGVIIVLGREKAAACRMETLAQRIIGFDAEGLLVTERAFPLWARAKAETELALQPQSPDFLRLGGSPG